MARRWWKVVWFERVAGEDVFEECPKELAPSLPNLIAVIFKNATDSKNGGTAVLGTQDLKDSGHTELYLHLVYRILSQRIRYE